MENITLSPPWETLRNEFIFTFGNNPLVTIKPLNSSNLNKKMFSLKIIVKDDIMAFSLRQIIKPIFHFGEIIVKTVIKNSIGNIEKIINTKYTISEVANLYNISLKNNSLFNKFVIKDDTLFLIFNKSIIQFFNDDISDLYGIYNQIASVVFEKLSINTFKSKDTPYLNFLVNFNTDYEKSMSNIISSNKLF